MIFGNCPHCDEGFDIGVPDGVRLPVYSRMTCISCGKWFWEKITRIDPQSYLPNEIEVDENGQSVKIK